MADGESLNKAKDNNKNEEKTASKNVKTATNQLVVIDKNKESDVVKAQENTDKNKEKNKLYNLFLFFLIFSIIGWICETAYTSIQLGLTKRGFLLGPYCPIYGCGATMLIIALSYMEKGNVSHKYLKIFVGCMIVFTLFEYITGYALEALFKIRCWDYPNDFMNINGRVSLLYCFMWGLAGILFTKLLYPLYKKGCKALDKLNFTTKKAIVYMCAFVFILDIILSCIKYLS